MTKLGVLCLLTVSLAVSLGITGCGGDDTRPPVSGSGGTGGAGGTDADAQVPFDGGEDAGPSEFGSLTIQLNNIEGMQGKQVIVEVINSDSMASVAGVCAQVTADPFSTTVMATTRISPALCDYSADTQIGIGDYTVVVQVQEPEVFPSILCADISATVVTGENTTVTVDNYRSCTGGFPDGTYSGTPLTCSTTMQPIAHTSVDAATELLEFTGATITAERSGTQWLETHEDSDCKLEITREIIREMMGVATVTFSTNRTYAWTPADCTFTVTANGSAVEVGSSSPLLQPSANFRSDDIWFYSMSGASYRFASAQGVWTVLMPPLEVPCDMTDALVRTWSRR